MDWIYKVDTFPTLFPIRDNSDKETLLPELDVYKWETVGFMSTVRFGSARLDLMNRNVLLEANCGVSY